MHDFWGDYAFTAFYAIGWTLVFESPILAIEKVLSQRFGRKEDKEKNISVIDVLNAAENSKTNL